MVGNDNFDNYNDELNEVEMKTKKNKRLVLNGIVICGALIVVVLIAIIYFIIEDKNTLKMYFNTKKISIPETMIIDEKDGNRYISINQVCDLVGYKYMTGRYDDYNSDEKSFFVQNDKEAANFTIDSNVLTKNITYLTDSIDLKESYELKNPIKKYGQETYVNIENLRELFNMYVNNTEKRIDLYSLDYLDTSYQEKVKQAGYESLSEEYKNKRAMAYGLIVVKNAEGKFGAVDLNMKNVIDQRYDKMEFVQNTMSFFVKDGNYDGLVTSENKVEIAPNKYSNIAVLDEKQKLYIVYKDDLCGVINLNIDQDDKEVIYVEFEQIGIDNIAEFKKSGETNAKLLFNKCIPVKKGGKWGIYDVKGNVILNVAYDSLGYVKNLSDVISVNSILTIPQSVGFEGIVICKDKKYGIVTTSGKLIPCSNTKIFSKTESGKTQYFMQFNGKDTELSEWARLNNFIENNSSTTNNNNSTSNTETQNNIQNNISENTFVENNITENNVNENSENTNTSGNGSSFLENILNSIDVENDRNKVNNMVNDLSALAQDILNDYNELKYNQNVTDSLQDGIDTPKKYVEMRLKDGLENIMITENDNVFTATSSDNTNLTVKFTVNDDGSLNFIN